jgi:hypothetical protein
MSKVTKQDVVEAFQQNKRKRSLLLYEYYFADYFSGSYSAPYIAEKITADLGITITANMVRIARHRVGKSARSSSVHRQLKDELRAEILLSLQPGLRPFEGKDHPQDTGPLPSDLPQLSFVQKSLPADKTQPVTAADLLTLPAGQIERLPLQTFAQLISSELLTDAQLDLLLSRVQSPAFRQALTRQIELRAAGKPSDQPGDQSTKDTSKIIEKIQKNKYQNAEDENKKNPFVDLMKGL